MIKTDTAFAQLLFTTMRIEAHFDNGQQPRCGTGFYFLFDRDNVEPIPALITNKHVIQDADEVVFYVHEAISRDQYKPRDECIRLVLRGSGNTKISNWWILHPGDVDLCALPCAFLFDEAEAINKVIYMKAFAEESLFSDDELNKLTSLEDVFMFGSPIGIRDEMNNLPLVRRGILSSHPALDFNGRPIGVADIATFPGSSGSPILKVDVDAATAPITDDAWEYDRSKLVGILFAYPPYIANGKVDIVNIPTTATALVSTVIPPHLGFYIKAREILTLKKHVVDTILQYRSIYGIK